MLKKFVAALTITAMASAAFAANVSDSTKNYTVKTPAPNNSYKAQPSVSETVVEVDISGVETWNAEGDATQHDSDR